MGKIPGTMYSCDKKKCKGQQFIASDVQQRVDGAKVALNSMAPVDWTQEGDKWFCPKCSKEYNAWLEGSK